jgi:hypothetical protein
VLLDLSPPFFMGGSKGVSQKARNWVSFQRPNFHPWLVRRVKVRTSKGHASLPFARSEITDAASKLVLVWDLPPGVMGLMADGSV